MVPNVPQSTVVATKVVSDGGHIAADLLLSGHFGECGVSPDRRRERTDAMSDRGTTSWEIVPVTVTVHLNIAEGIATITLDRPERRNALSAHELEQFDDHLDAIEAAVADGSVRCAVVRGSNGQFCSGADLTELEDLRFTDHLRTVLSRIEALAVPVIASIEGACMGLGVQLALASDIRIAARDAQFAIPVAKLGLMVDHWTLRRATALLGGSTVRYMMLSASVVGADDAHRVGFVNEIAPPARALEMASAIARLAHLTLAGTKAGLNRLGTAELDESGWDPDYRAAFAAAWASADFAEGRRAFTERRAPLFRGE